MVVRSCCVIVKATGTLPDEELDEALLHVSVAQCDDDRVALGSSGVVVAAEQGLVVTPASSLCGMLEDGATPRLRPGTSLHVAAPSPRGIVDGWLEADFVRVVALPRTAQVLARLLSGSGFVGKRGLERLVILRVRANGALAHVPSLRQSWSPHPPGLPLGCALRVVATPYSVNAPVVFANAVVQGILSASFDGGELLLTDARFLPGCQGGLVSRADDGTVVGIVLAPLPRANGFPTELTTVLPIHALTDLYNGLPALGMVRATPAALRGDALEAAAVVAAIRSARSAAVQVIVGKAWGSGVIVALRPRAGDLGRAATATKRPRTASILTNAHVVKSAATGASVRVGFDGLAGSRYRPAHVRWTSPSRVPDLAVLEAVVPIDASQMATVPLPLFTGPLEALHGDLVAVLGYPLFSPSTSRELVATTGVLSVCSTISAASGSPRAVMLHTSASVHEGNSGGMVVHVKSRSLVGVINSNAHWGLGDDATVLPRLSFAVPVTLFSTALRVVWEKTEVPHQRRWYERGGGRVGLDAANGETGEGQETLEKIWDLDPPSLPLLGQGAPSSRRVRLLVAEECCEEDSTSRGHGIGRKSSATRVVRRAKL